MRIKSILLKELRHILRDPRTLIFIVFIPLFILVVIGYALNLDIKNINFMVLDNDKSEYSRKLIDCFINSGHFIFLGFLETQKEIDESLANEKIKIALLIPPHFQSDLTGGKRQVKVGLILDGSNSLIGRTVLSYAELLVANFSNNLIEQKTLLFPTPQVQVEVRPRLWFNPDLSSARFLIPGLISFILMVTAVVSTSLSIVKEKENSSLENLFLSPLFSFEILLGKIIPYFGLAILNTSLILLTSQIFFNIGIAGSIIELWLVTIVFLIGCLALGLIISTLVDTQQNAFLITVFLTVLPSYILSGFVFPLRSMPTIIQFFSYFIPNRYFLAALRAIMIRGVNLENYWPDFVSLAIFSFLMIGLSLLRLVQLEKKR